MRFVRGLCFCLLSGLLWLSPGSANAQSGPFRLATFSVDVTVPLGHRCMGLLPTKTVRVLDPLEAHGFVLLGGVDPIVVVAVDWCEIRNGAFDAWRETLAKAAGTRRECVLVTSLHQHDAPVVDAGAAALLREVGLANELYDEAFHARVLDRVGQAVREALPLAHPITHVGTGEAPVERIASNRRLVLSDGRVTFERGSRSASDSVSAGAPEGEIDPLLKTLSFWNGETPVAALSVYATHPMSAYGRGEISADFVGLARRQRQADLPGVKQIYAPGCSGDVTAGKYNDGSPESRLGLIERLHAGMVRAWEKTQRKPLQQINFHSAPLQLEFYAHAQLSAEHLERVLRDPQQPTEERIYAAMGLSNRQRVASGQPIDVPCVDLGGAQLVLLPGEAFVGYQLMAQDLRSDEFVVTLGYGECWPGYIPTEAAFADHFHDRWLWVAPGSETLMREALLKILRP